MRKFIRTPVATGLLMAAGAVLIGCSDDNSYSSYTTAEDSALKGTFVDAAVDGLNYQSTYTGLTANGGHYNYEEGDMVAFSIGQLVLGSLAASADEVGPRDFFDDVDMLDQRLRNILVILQTLDSDGDLSNGITITADAVAALEAAMEDAGYDLSTLNLSTMTEEEANTLKDKLPTILAAVVAATNSPDDVVVDEDDAVSHYVETLGGVTVQKNVSQTPEAGSGGHSVTTMSVVTDFTNAGGDVDTAVKVHPLLVSYADVVLGDFAMGTGSSEIPDIEHAADVFVSVSLDNGSTWKKTNISNTGDKSSIQVDFYGNTQLLDYYGHSFSPVIKTEGGNVLLAWNDKYCPSGNPLGLENTGTEGEPVYVDDLYLVNGPQGIIDYEGVETYGDEVVPAHEVPFSCVWTARGVYDAETHQVIWRAPMQLTTGRRDSNKIAIDSSDEGFVITWQEDPTGLRPGGGAGPGDGWSGASTNHRTDIWYSYITMASFAATDGEVVDGETTKPKSMYNLSYPVPVSDNAVCRNNSGSSAKYCVALCEANGFLEDAESNDDGKCYSSYMDPITELYHEADSEVVIEPQLLNGDTGASRPVIALFGSKVILGYEETKGLAENLPGIPNTESGDIPVEQQGKIAYVHSFDMAAEPATFAVAPGTIVNPLRPNEEDGTPVLENVRRLTMVSQVDASEATEGDFLWGILYKSGIETQGASSDMYLRLADGYDVSNLGECDSVHNCWNLSSLTAATEETEKGTWDASNLDDATWENDWENTFSPRGFLRGSSIFIGYEYTPSWRVAQQGHLSNNFNIIRSFDNGTTWQAPIDVSNITNNTTSTLDPRLIPTSETVAGSPLASDVSDPNTLFVSYGTLDLQTGLELDLYVTRSTDSGETWETVPSTVDGSPVNEAITKTAAEEKEVQGFAVPDGKTLFSIWLQELDPDEAPEGTPERVLGSDIWIQRKEYVDENI